MEKVLSIPRAVDSFEAAGLNDAIVESLVLKFLVNTGMASGRRIAAELGLAVSALSRFPAAAQESAGARLHQFSVCE